jgi:xylulokinase
MREGVAVSGGGGSGSGSGSGQSRDVWVGLDLGTSGLKGLAVDRHGQVLARASAGYGTARPEAGAAEQDPDQWIAAVRQVMGQLAGELDAQRWGGIGLSAMLPTLVTLDATGRPTGPALTWQDARAEAFGDALRDEVGADELYRRTGQWVDGRYLVPMWRRVVEVDRERAGATSTVCGAKDFLLGYLTGTVATDPSTAAGYACYDLRAQEWAADLGAPAEVALPDVMPATTTVPMSASAAAELGVPADVPVAVGAADSVLGALGMGVRQPGDVAYVAGTSTVVFGLGDRHVVDAAHRFLVTPTWLADRWGLEMDLLATGSAFRWLAGLVGVADEATLLRLAASADPSAAPLVLPYVGPGEQGALWDPDLLGAMIGLHVGHGPADLALGLVLGIVVESRRCLQVLETLGFDRRPLLVAGGSATDPWFRQQLADATGRWVVAPIDGDSDYSALGAAAVAAAGKGLVLPVGLGAATTTVPVPERATWWSALADRLDLARGVVGHGVSRT